MNLQLGGHAEGLIAHITLVRFLSSVRSPMPLQVAGEGECCRTLITLIWFLTCVAPHVNFQVDKLVERGRALFALESFFPTVSVDVPFEVRGRHERCRTLITLVRANSMGSGMDNQFFGAGKHLTALSTPHTFGVVVAQSVPSQLFTILVRLVTHTTLEQQHLTNI